MAEVEVKIGVDCSLKYMVRHNDRAFSVKNYTLKQSSIKHWLHEQLSMVDPNYFVEEQWLEQTPHGIIFENNLPSGLVTVAHDEEPLLGAEPMDYIITFYLNEENPKFINYICKEFDNIIRKLDNLEKSISGKPMFIQEDTLPFDVRTIINEATTYATALNLGKATRRKIDNFFGVTDPDEITKFGLSKSMEEHLNKVLRNIAKENSTRQRKLVFGDNKQPNFFEKLAKVINFLLS